MSRAIAQLRASSGAPTTTITTPDQPAGVRADASHADSVAPAPTSLAVADRSQHDRAPAPHQLRRGAGRGGSGGRLGPQAWTGIRAHVSRLAAGPERPSARASSRVAG